MAPSTRRYSTQTRRVLDIQSLNQCAFPECTNILVEPATGKASPGVTADTCHIHAISPGGPRWKEGLTVEELNSTDNLILLCKNHHAVVDLQPEVYTAELLKQWKSDHEAKVYRSSPGQNLISEVIQDRILQKTLILRQLRFFSSFNEVSFSVDFASDLIEGELSIGPDTDRSSALAWCARVLSHTEHLAKARECLSLATTLPACEEVGIAEAYLSSIGKDKSAALNMLLRKDSPMYRSAAIGLVTRRDGAQAAVDWLRDTQFKASDLDGEGKLRLLGNCLELGDLKAARRHLHAITQQDIEEAPFLLRIKAVIYLLSAVPQELHSLVRTQLPLGANVFPLATTPDAMKDRRQARRLLVQAGEVAKGLDCQDDAAMDEEYALWLDLLDPDEEDSARKRLAGKLSDSEASNALRFVRLAVEFGISIDHDAIDQEIKRQIALNGTITPEAAHARFALALAKTSAREKANYLSLHLKDIVEQLGAKLVLSVQIELFCQAGEVEQADRTLSNLLSQENLADAEEGRLRALISEAEGAEGVRPGEIYKKQFTETGSLPDLATLVDYLVREGDWESLCEYAKMLFDRTQSLSDGERFAVTLFNTQRTSLLAEFLESIGDSFIDQSEQLRLLHCWVLYYRGMVREARCKLVGLDPSWDNPAYRGLYENLAISSGDWDSLTTMVDNDWAGRGERSAPELIRSAQIAFFLGLPRAKELLSVATDKGESDPEILVTAYVLANMMGMEGEEEVSKWIDRAAAMSGEAGPVKMIPLEGLVAEKAVWDRKESEMEQLLTRGEIPLLLAGQALNRSLIELMLFPALRNPEEEDPRRRRLVPAYSGKRGMAAAALGGSVGMDASALLTLGYLDLLEEAFDAFEEIHLPYSTMGWLFEEKQRAVFHQPSRIRDAVEVSQMLASGALERLVGDATPNTGLSEQVGEELAQLIAEAEEEGYGEGLQRLVVHPFPVHRVGSLMTEEVDLSGHAAVLVGCSSIVRKLSEEGRITDHERTQGEAYLRLREKPWPNEPSMPDTPILYLDTLAITYLHHLGLLGSMARAGFRMVVSPRVVAEAEDLVRYGEVSSAAAEVIERIRSSVSVGIESGKVRMGRFPDLGGRVGSMERWGSTMFEDSTRGLALLVEDCDAIVTDDRFLNQHSQLVEDSLAKPTLTTLELMAALRSEREPCPAEWQYRTTLRRAGYYHVPVGEAELEHHLQSSLVRDGKLAETAELRAIRENHLCVRMGSVLQIPKELPWIVHLVRTFAQVLKNLWTVNQDYSEIRTRSAWIVEQIDIRAWAHCFGLEGGKDLGRTGQGPYLLFMLYPPIPSTPEVRKEYWQWMEERLLEPIKEQNPDLFSWIVEFQRRHIAEIASKDPSEEASSDD